MSLVYIKFPDREDNAWKVQTPGRKAGRQEAVDPIKYTQGYFLRQLVPQLHYASGHLSPSSDGGLYGAWLSTEMEAGRRLL
ncbi:hypothetical protein PISMIDRAFT_680940 [Pisolithus microcarpus 441]|uniref:Unplaced genomic scaffold scaffold_62, whole genome shotgun sequence n=1 Tax=Pisolithus microcarpus 441 TaxID=765257 RepID=A0A0C9YYG6_9AGAM|nr:hypothetical protein PISMIDRAFT_680940 [Pisolithus microcarpus 441]